MTEIEYRDSVAVTSSEEAVKSSFAYSAALAFATRKTRKEFLSLHRERFPDFFKPRLRHDVVVMRAMTYLEPYLKGVAPLTPIQCAEVGIFVDRLFRVSSARKFVTILADGCDSRFPTTKNTGWRQVFSNMACARGVEH